jgi:D-alanyl-lipoteichoic acid acyltransferase DltB (MBOAT superfamily)
VPFNSFLFLLWFLPLTLAGYAVVSRVGLGWAKAWLIGASLAFYAIGAWRFLPVLLLSVAGNLLLLRAMPWCRRRDVLVAVGVALNLALLGWFKYAAPVFGMDEGLPLGISFFTFTQIGCLLSQAASDKPPPAAQDQALFALFFPALIAGPIQNPHETLPQFTRQGGWNLTADNLAVGGVFFLIGLLKKSLLADPLASVVNAAFADPSALSLLPAWQAATAWSLQLYFDFSGYTDMAIGLAWMFGFRFPDNFEQPYRAKSVIQYWQRWHMSLTRFLMANVHAPMTLAILRHRRSKGLSINQAAQRTISGFTVMIATPIAATMVLVGIWHGPALTFLLFGLLHTLFLLINHAWRLRGGPALPPILSGAITYAAVLIGSVLFRAESAAYAGSMLVSMTGWHGLGPATVDARGVLNAMWIAVLYGIVWLAPTTRQIMAGKTSGSMSWRPTPRWAIATGFAATLGILASGGAGEFVYFRF